MSWWCDSGYRSSTTCPHHGPAGADPGLDTMVKVGAFQSIRPTIKYQPRKANVVADALSRSQCKVDESSTNNSTASTATAIKAQVTALSGMSMELTAEDLQK